MLKETHKLGKIPWNLVENDCETSAAYNELYKKGDHTNYEQAWEVLDVVPKTWNRFSSLIHHSNSNNKNK